MATVLSLSLGLGCSREGPLRRERVFTGETMGTTFTVKVVDRPGTAVDGGSLTESILARLNAIDAAMSTYREDSEISRFNSAETTDWFVVSSDTANVVGEALKIGKQTGGAFDITVGPVLRLWHFGAGTVEEEKAIPSDEEIAATKKRTDYLLISVRESPPALKKRRSDVTLDLSGIAKGYAVDEIAAILDREGVADYMVEIGGEVTARGRNDRNVPWRIAVEKPLAGERSIQRVVSLRDAAMATSGDYRSFFEIDGERYSHVIDPRTASPVSHELVSVTVVSARCATADALATGLMVLGPVEGYAVAREADIPALFILRTAEGFVQRATPAFARLEVR